MLFHKLPHSLLMLFFIKLIIKKHLYSYTGKNKDNTFFSCRYSFQFRKLEKYYFPINNFLSHQDVIKYMYMVTIGQPCMLTNYKY